MADLRELFDLVDIAIARSQGVLPEQERRGIAEVARRARHRAGFLGELLVVALAGGTGSGKSSLINALLSEAVVDVGVIRPTTSHAVAVVPAEGMIDLQRLIDDLAVGEVIPSRSLSTTVLVDLPDFDSIETAHRHIVEVVLPTVDAVVWVVDPEKYADPVIHEGFLSPLSRYGAQFIFAMNHADRLPGFVEVVLDDFASRLRSGGYIDPDVVATVATQPVDVGGLEDVIARRFDTKITALSKLAIDLTTVANDAWRLCSDWADAASEEEDVADAALAAATFVSLGVEAYDFQSSIMRGPRG